MNITATTILLVFIPCIQGEVFCPWKRARVYYCGSDGKTYNTLCDLQKAISQTHNLSIAHKGACEGDNISTTSEERPNGDKETSIRLPKEPVTDITSEDKSPDEEEDESSVEEDQSKSLEEEIKEEQTGSTVQQSLSVTKKEKVFKKPKLKKKKRKSKKSKSKIKSKTLKKSKPKISSLNIKNTAKNVNSITIGGKRGKNIKVSNNVNNKNIINIHYWLRMIPSLPQSSRRTMYRIFNFGF